MNATMCKIHDYWKLLYSTRSSTRFSGMTSVGGMRIGGREVHEEWAIGIHKLIHVSVQQKLTQYCAAILLQ